MSGVCQALALPWCSGMGTGVKCLEITGGKGPFPAGSGLSCSLRSLVKEQGCDLALRGDSLAKKSWAAGI